MSDDFVESFTKRLVTEFDCSEREAARIAKHAQRHSRNIGVERTVDEWVGLISDSEADTLVQRWKLVVDSDMDLDFGWSNNH